MSRSCLDKEADAHSLRRSLGSYFVIFTLIGGKHLTSMCMQSTWRILLKWRFWFLVDPMSLHFYQAPRWCQNRHCSWLVDCNSCNETWLTLLPKCVVSLYMCGLNWGQGPVILQRIEKGWWFVGSPRSSICGTWLFLWSCPALAPHVPRFERWCHRRPFKTL